MTMPVASARSRVFDSARGPDRRKFPLNRPAHDAARTRCTWAVAGIMVLLCHVACAAGWDAPLTGIPAGFGRSASDQWRPDDGTWAVGPRAVSYRHVRDPNAPVDVAPSLYDNPALSTEAIRVSLIASRNGDWNFLMVDKVHGQIILFENGRPVLIRAALTGESMGDQIPPDGWIKPWSEQRGVRYKVTPAGRFTLTRNRDRRLGDLFEVNELKGRDWTIAIHQVWLGNQSEHRDARLRSPMGDDKHITEGCVDVDSGTLAELLRILPGSGMPIYILPVDTSLISQLFRPRETLPRRYETVGYYGWRWSVWNAASAVPGGNELNAPRVR